MSTAPCRPVSLPSQRSDFAGSAKAGEVPAHRASIDRVVVRDQELAHHLIHLPAACCLLPGVDHFVAAHEAQGLEPAAEGLDVAGEMRVLVEEQGDASVEIEIEGNARRGAHRLDQRFGNAQPADRAALAFDVDGSARVELAQCCTEAGVEVLLRRLGRPGQQAEHRTAMLGQGFEVEHLRPARRQRPQQPALARAGGAADDAQLEPPGQRLELGQQGAAIAHVAALENVDAKADLREDGRQRRAALTAAPAVDERRPFARQLQHVLLDVRGDVAGDQRGAALARRERRDLRVFGADERTLGVVERRPVDGAG